MENYRIADGIVQSNRRVLICSIIQGLDRTKSKKVKC